MNDRFLRALRGEPTDTVPIWLMRQAGRYLPGYRELRRAHSILEIAREPELALAATLEPVRRFDLDAAVVFADIMLPLDGIGLEFGIDPGRGPVVPRPVREEDDLDRLRPFDPRPLEPVAETIRRYREAEPDRPIVGFAAAPFTLAAYLIEGGASREYPATRRMLYAHPDRFGRLLDRLTEMTVAYLRLQSRAGAQALQLFDTWVGLLPATEFRDLVRPRLDRLVDALHETDAPTIYFSTGSAHLLGVLDGLAVDALGVDWRLPLGEVRARLARPYALQGNLDPGALLGDASAIHRTARAVLDALPDHRAHVFNLGHGVLPETPPDAVHELVRFVHEQGRASPA